MSQNTSVVPKLGEIPFTGFCDMVFTSFRDAQTCSLTDGQIRLHYASRAVLTPSTPAVPNCCCSNGPEPYWSNPPFLIFDIRALWLS